MEFDKTKLRRLDLGLLLTFLGLIEHRKAADVASDLGLTKSSISHALGRLRDIFDDELFLRRANGLEPTAFALAIEPDMRQAVQSLQLALVGQPEFVPNESNAVLRISALDHSMAGILPKFVAEVSKRAPNVRLKIYSKGRSAALSAFEGDALDLAVGFFWDLPEHLIREQLVAEKYLIIGAKRNPVMHQPLTLDSYCRAEHLVVSQNGDLRGVVDRALRGLGRSRNVTVSVPMFFPAMTIVAQSNLLSALPAALVMQFSERFELAYQPPPLDIRPFEISVVRRRRDEKNKALLWAISVLQDTVKVG